MKKIVTSYSENLPSAKLYLDDIQRIVEILEGSSHKVTLQAEGYTLENLGELPQLRKDSIHMFSIESTDPYISLAACPSIQFSTR